jgi:hypothetical protein
MHYASSLQNFGTFTRTSNITYLSSGKRGRAEHNKKDIKNSQELPELERDAYKAGRTRELPEGDGTAEHDRYCGKIGSEKPEYQPRCGVTESPANMEYCSF